MAAPSDLLIGIDAGTSVIKAVAFDLAGAQIAISSVPNRYDTGQGGAATQDMARTWKDCAAVLRALGEKVPRLAARAQALAVTGQGDGTWLIGRGNAPLAPAWLWLDARAAPTVARLRAAPEDEARFAITGTGLNACQMGTQLAHMLAHSPEMLAGAEAALHCKDWLYLNLTGQRATDPSEALFTFGDFRTRAYREEVTAALGLSRLRHLLPPILEGAETSHPLTREAAEATGLRAGMPVVLGYLDVVSAAMGAGIHTRGTPAACTIIGSTGMHMRALPAAEVRLSPERNGYTMVLPVPGLAAQMHSNMAATLNIDWLLALAEGVLAEFGAGASRADLLARLDGWIAAAKPGALLYHPYISEAGERGPFVDTAARAGFQGLSSAHRFPDLARAVAEGLGLAARDCYAAMGKPPPELRITGGAARSSALRAILAAAVDAPLRVSAREEAGAAGAAMLAALSIGAYPDMEAAIADWVSPLLGPAEAPDPALAETYARLYPSYRALREAMPPVWARLAAIREGAHG